MGDRREERLITAIRVDTWRIKRDYYKLVYSLFRTEDVKRLDNIILQVFKEKLKIASRKTQLEYLSKETNVKRAEYTMSLINKAILWEVSASPLILDAIKNIRYGNNEPISKDDVILMKKAISQDLGVSYNENIFDRKKQIEYYKNEIILALETTEERIYPILYEITKLCEFDSVLGSIQNCSYVSALPKRDRKKIHEEKRKFDRTKKKTIEGLKFLKMPYEDVEKKQYILHEEWVNYEKTLKHIKEVLYNDLTLICGTSKAKAEKIIKILEYI